MDNNGVSLKIVSDAKSADNQLEQLISLLTKTNTLISKIKGNNGITGVAKDTQNTNEKLNKTNTLLKGMNDKLKMPNLRSWASTIRRITGYLTSMVQESSAYIENLNLLQVAFGDSSTAAESFVNGLADIYGLDESTLTRYLAYYRNFGRTLGIASDKADMLSKNLLKMQLDISSLYNLSFQESGQKLLSALAGQTKPIRSGTGADITQSTLQLTLDKMGIDKTAKELTRAEKVITIYLSLVDQLSSAQGDLARTINSPANQMKIFSEQVSRAARNLGNLFLPVLATVLPWLNGLLMVFSELVETLMGFLGIDVAGFWDSMSTGDTSTIDDLTASLDDTSAAADKATKSLRGFDKLNVINTPTNTDTSSSLGGVDSRLLDALDAYDLKLSNIKNKATDIRDRIMGWLGFTKSTNEETGEITWNFDKISKLDFSKVTDSWGKFTEALGRLGSTIIDSISWFYDNVLVPLSIYTVNEFLPSWIDLFTAAINALDVIINSAKPSIDYMWETFLKPLLKITGIALIELLNLLTEALQKFSDWASNNQEAVKNITEVIISFLAGLWLYLGVKKITSLITILSTVLGAGGLTAALTALNIPLLISTAAFGGLVWGIIEISKYWDKMTPSERAIASLGAMALAITGVAIAVGALQSAWSLGIAAVAIVAGVAAITLSISKAKKEMSTPITTSQAIKGSARFANGGFPEEGQMFIAREAGAEMVGQIGNKTAVANNDQIVDSISNGVYRALVSSNFGSNGNTIIEVSEKGGILDHLEFKQKQKDRQYGL